MAGEVGDVAGGVMVVAGTITTMIIITTMVRHVTQPVANHIQLQPAVNGYRCNSV